MQKIEVRRRFRGKGTILVKPGQIVTFQDKIANIEYLPGRLVRCDVAFELGCEPQNVSSYVNHKPGDWIDQGSELVTYNRFFTKRTILSPISGFYVFTSKVLGHIFIREPLLLDQDKHKESMIKTFEQSNINRNSKKQRDEDEVLNIGHIIYDKFLEHTQNTALEKFDSTRQISGSGKYEAGFSGIISSIEQENEIVITSEGHRFQGVLGFGQQTYGKLSFLESYNDELQEWEVTGELKESIIVIRGWASLKALRRIEQFGALGLICGSIALDVLQEFCPEEPLLHLGHQMPISMTIIMMQKFGEAMSQEQFCELKSLHGHWCLIDGNTQLRAGCKRPEVLVPIKTQEVECATKFEC